MMITIQTKENLKKCQIQKYQILQHLLHYLLLYIALPFIKVLLSIKLT